MNKKVADCSQNEIKELLDRETLKVKLRKFIEEMEDVELKCVVANGLAYAKQVMQNVKEKN